MFYILVGQQDFVNRMRSFRIESSLSKKKEAQIEAKPTFLSQKTACNFGSSGKIV
ncbi:hypothetical protein [Leptospira ainazelensis]|uniref:hypothetical protein n=1 Tax=Leptospira ainazelensis TaxID=2810034 RepID=UPI001962B184|nr:hypothetical protein [Leptospira ainazelensis]